jgi:hypothetical protein
MAYATITVGSGWPAAPQITASGETVRTVVNSGKADLCIVSTADDTDPTISIWQGRTLCKPGEEATILLADGERGWLGFRGDHADAEIALHY